MRLTKSELSFLSKVYKNSNPLSLFSGEGAVLQGNEEKLLEEKDILKGGRPVAEAHKLLSTAADPQRCTRLVLKDGEYFVEKYAYKTNEDYVLVENDGGELVFSSGEQLEEVLFQLSQWVGISDFKTLDINTALSNDELIVFLSMADIRREKELMSYLGQNVESRIPFSRIREQLEKPRPGSLTSILTGHYKYSIPDIENTKKILDRLIIAEIIGFQAGEDQVGYFLVGAYEEFAEKFLIPQALVMLETFNHIEDKELAGAGVLCVWAGMREIISLAFREGATEIASISGRQLLKMMEEFLGCPDVRKVKDDQLP